MTRQQYNTLLRIGATFVGVLFAIVSVLFSVDGFSIQATGKAWVGFILAIGVFLVELVWNQHGLETKNMTLMIGGLLAYVYGVVTNILGLALQQGELTNEPLRYILPIITGLFLEFMPEPLIIWGLLGDASNGGDVLKNVFGTMSSTMGNKQHQRPTPTSGRPGLVNLQSKNNGGHRPINRSLPMVIKNTMPTERAHFDIFENK